MYKMLDLTNFNIKEAEYWMYIACLNVKMLIFPANIHWFGLATPNNH